MRNVLDNQKHPFVDFAQIYNEISDEMHFLCVLSLESD